MPDDVRAAVSDRAWLAALLEAERALANAEAIAGRDPRRCRRRDRRSHARPELFDAAGLAEAGPRAPPNPVEPLVRELAAAVGGEAAAYVHWGATSQDIMDTAAMLVSKRALGLVCGGWTRPPSAARSWRAPTARRRWPGGRSSSTRSRRRSG